MCPAHSSRQPLLTTASQEFDTPLNLFMKDGSIFRGMCERSNISLDEIHKAVLRSQDL